MKQPSNDALIWIISEDNDFDYDLIVTNESEYKRFIDSIAQTRLIAKSKQ